MTGSTASVRGRPRSLRTSSATAAGERGASGRITSAALSSCGRRAAASATSRTPRPALQVVRRELLARSHPRADEPTAPWRATDRARGRRAPRRASGRRPRCPPPRGPGSGRCGGGAPPGGGSSRTQSARSLRGLERDLGIVSVGALVPEIGDGSRAPRPPSRTETGTLIPRPLSSHTKSSGTGRCWCAACAVVLSAACAVAWLSEASPKLQTAIASSGQAHSTPSLRARSIAIATPTARGRCEAIVDVCGITASSWWPNTLCRPPAIGSSIAAVTPSSTSGTPSRPDLGGAGEVERARAVVEQRRVGRAERQRHDRVALVPRRADL